MIDFGARPPEINSSLMWGGPGSAPLIASGAAWTELATSLGSTTTAFSAVLASLTDSYMGPASVALVTAAMPFAIWLASHAAGAASTAVAAAQAAQAYEAARAGTIHPSVVAENRARLAALVATNFLGVNAPAIAATEAQYAEYWAQDAAAMYGWAADGATATGALAGTPFLPPVPVANPAGMAGQAGAVAQAAGQGAGAAAQTSTQAGSAMSGMGGSLGTAMSAGQSAMSAFPQALQELAKPFGNMSQFLQPLTSMFGQGGQFMNPLMSGIMPMMAGMGSTGSLGSLGSLGSGMGGGGMGGMPMVAASMGRSPMMGGLTVPQSWVNQTSSMRAASPEPMGKFAPEWAAPAAEETDAPKAPITGGMGGMPMMAGMAGMNQGGSGRRLGMTSAAFDGINEPKWN